MQYYTYVFQFESNLSGGNAFAEITGSSLGVPVSRTIKPRRIAITATAGYDSACCGFLVEGFTPLAAETAVTTREAIVSPFVKTRQILNYPRGIDPGQFGGSEKVARVWIRVPTGASEGTAKLTVKTEFWAVVGPPGVSGTATAREVVICPQVPHVDSVYGPGETRCLTHEEQVEKPSPPAT